VNKAQSGALASLLLVAVVLGATATAASAARAERACTPGVTKVAGGVARTFCGSAKAAVTRNGKTVTFKGGECEIYPRYLVVNIGTASPTGNKPYFGLLVGKHPAATAADPVVSGDGVYRKGLVTAKAPGFSAGLYNNPDLKIALAHGRRTGTFSGSKPGSKLFGTPAEKISGSFTC
jgi:hypothetical protein